MNLRKYAGNIFSAKDGEIKQVIKFLDEALPQVPSAQTGVSGDSLFPPQIPDEFIPKLSPACYDPRTSVADSETDLRINQCCAD